MNCKPIVLLFISISNVFSQYWFIKTKQLVTVLSAVWRAGAMGSLPTHHFNINNSQEPQAGPSPGRGQPAVPVQAAKEELCSGAGLGWD